jgi:hypothetical protein
MHYAEHPPGRGEGDGDREKIPYTPFIRFGARSIEKRDETTYPANSPEFKKLEKDIEGLPASSRYAHSETNPEGYFAAEIAHRVNVALSRYLAGISLVEAVMVVPGGTLKESDDFGLRDRVRQMLSERGPDSLDRSSALHDAVKIERAKRLAVGREVLVDPKERAWERHQAQVADYYAEMIFIDADDTDNANSPEDLINRCKPVVANYEHGYKPAHAEAGEGAKKISPYAYAQYQYARRIVEDPKIAARAYRELEQERAYDAWRRQVIGPVEQYLAEAFEMPNFKDKFNGAVYQTFMDELYQRSNGDADEAKKESTMSAVLTSLLEDPNVRRAETEE